MISFKSSTSFDCYSILHSRENCLVKIMSENKQELFANSVIELPLKLFSSICFTPLKAQNNCSKIDRIKHQLKKFLFFIVIINMHYVVAAFTIYMILNFDDLMVASETFIYIINNAGALSKLSSVWWFRQN